MSESVRRLRANKKLEGTPCAWCQGALVLGDEAAACEACGRAHHAACWDGENGCGGKDCAHAPLARLEEPAPAPKPAGFPLAPGLGAALGPGQVSCPGCGKPVRASADLCDWCDRVLSADGVYRGPKVEAPGAVSSLVLGIVGLFICGPVLGAIALSESAKAKRGIAMNPRYGGEGLATAGFVLGIIGIVLHGLLIVVYATTWR